MKLTMLLLATGAIALAPTAILAKPGHTTRPSQATQPTTHGGGWDHLNGPTSTGQPGAECGEANAPLRPGRAEAARGSAFNEDGVAHSRYAGEQPQNSRNTASVSQYDTACLHQKH